MKTVIYTTTAARALRRHSNRAALIRAKIEHYASDPASVANNVKALVGVDMIRLRVGDFRVLFTESQDKITVHDIGPRSEIYE